jgi:hypothetical protein
MRANYSISIGIITGLLIVSTSDISCSATVPPVPQTVATLKTEPEDPRVWHREPFKKIEGLKSPAALQGTSGGAFSPVIQGIMRIDKHYYAIINGITVKTGDHIDEWTVANISRHRVTLRHEKESQTFDIYQGRINRGNQ